MYNAKLCHCKEIFSTFMVLAFFKELQTNFIQQPFYIQQYILFQFRRAKEIYEAVEKGNNIDMEIDKGELWNYRHAEFFNFTFIHIAARNNNAAFLRRVFDGNQASKQ